MRGPSLTQTYLRGIPAALQQQRTRTINLHEDQTAHYGSQALEVLEVLLNGS